MARQEIVGGWIELRYPKAVPEKMRRPILARATTMQRKAQALENGDADDDAVMSLYEFNDLVSVALIQAWSFSDSVSVEGLTDLPSGTYDQIQKITAPMIVDLMPSFEVDPDPVSPTEPSVE